MRKKHYASENKKLSTSLPEPSSGGNLFDVTREVAAIREIRRVEEQYGQVDVSTHRDLLAKSREADPELKAALENQPGTKPHPILQDQAYFSGVDEIRNNPMYSMNSEAELRYKEQELRYNNEKKLRKVHSKQFNPTPRPL